MSYREHNWGTPGNWYVLEPYVKDLIEKGYLYMKGGDLSNELAPAIGIRFERVIRTEEGKLNKSCKGFIQDIMRVDANIYIITTESQRKALAFLTKWRVPYSKVIEAASPLEIPDIAREQDFITYYDLEREVLQNINTRGNKKVKGELWTSVDVG